MTCAQSCRGQPIVSAAIRCRWSDAARRRPGDAGLPGPVHAGVPVLRRPALLPAVSDTNLRGLLAEVGLSFADVVEMTSYHVGLQAHMQTFTEVKDGFMAAPHAAWTAVGISELAVLGALVEIQVTARLTR
jgi:hypothetical protein